MINQKRVIYKNAKISAQKVIPVIDLVRGLETKNAINLLKFSKKKASLLITKLLNSAIANAKNNYKITSSTLFISTIYVCKARSLKRLKIRAKGRSDKIQKRYCHIFLKLSEIK